MSQIPALAIRYAQRSDAGRVRRVNEDTSAVRELLLEDRPALIAVIADGMGGAAGGAEASQIAVTTALQWLSDALRSRLPRTEHDWSELLRMALHVANQAVHDRAQRLRSLRGMGTTLLVSVLWNRRVRIAHISDSRAYVVRPAVRQPKIMQLTADHTVVNELVEQGALSHADATQHPLRHQLARSLGPEPRVEPEITARNVRAGERLLLCSDGLPLHVADGELARTLSDSPTPETACDRLIALANERGGRDNVTVVVVAADRDDAAPLSV